MKYVIKESQLNAPPEIFLRQAGYAYISGKSGDDSFARSLGRNYYPRFHVYIERQGDNVIFNLHLDQKRPSYPGAHAHNAEYESEVVKEEILRIQNLINLRQ